MSQQIPLLQDEICSLEKAVRLYQSADSLQEQQLEICTDYAQDASNKINKLNKKVKRLRRVSGISAILSAILLIVCLSK